MITLSRKRKQKVLFISYNGVFEPLFHSQVLPYLKGLSKTGIEFILLTFEKNVFLTKEEKKKLSEFKAILKDESIKWHWLRYHKKPSLPATCYDILIGSLFSFYIVFKYRISLIHARSTVPCAMAFIVSRFSGVKFIFDIRGLMAQEYIEGGMWSDRSLSYRLVRYFDRLFFLSADYRVVLTQRIKGLMEKGGYVPYPKDRELKIEVIPSCVDTERFVFNNKGRNDIRSSLGIMDKFVLLYIGSLGTWYLLEEMLDFFACLKEKKSNAYFLIVTHNGKDQVEQALSRRQDKITKDVTVTFADPCNMPDYVSAGDAGIFFIKPSFSKQSSSPAKLAEYLACGLPVVINANVGDTGELVAVNNVGIVLKDMNRSSYIPAVSDLMRIKNDNTLSQRCRQTALNCFSLAIAIKGYKNVYERALFYCAKEAG